MLPTGVLLGLLFFTGVIITFWAVYFLVSRTASPWILKEAVQVPEQSIILVPGTAKLRRNGRSNPYFLGRMEAALELYGQGRVRHFILSGNGRSVRGNEALDMRQSLVDGGVPSACITLDEGSVRTVFTMTRCRSQLGQDKVVLVSQKFHLERAIFIGLHLGMQVTGYRAAEVTDPSGATMLLRELLARMRCMTDLGGRWVIAVWRNPSRSR